MSSVRRLFSTDRQREINGVEVTIGDAFFTLARAGGDNKAFIKALEKYARPHRRAIQLEAVSDEIATEIVHRTYAETVVKNWSGLDESDLIMDGSQVDEGKVYPPLPFSAANCLKLFKAQPDLFMALKAAADDFTNYRQVTREADGKNSPTV